MRKNASKNHLVSLLLLAALLAVITGVVRSGGHREASWRTHVVGPDRLISLEPLPAMDGDMCEWTPASANSSLISSFPQDQAAAKRSSSSADAPRPSEAARSELAKRKPVRVLQDPYSAFAGLAVDPVRNEVVMADENMFSIHVYDRMENTPPRAKMSEPKRMIHGENTYLEFVCSLYVDPANGDIYAINNDTMNWMPVFSRDAKGDMAPTRILATVTCAFGIVADDEQ